MIEVARPQALAACTWQELLAHFAEIEAELRRRDILRSSNNPVGDLAEWLFCKAFGWTRSERSNADFDAIDPADDKRYQIKGRRITTSNPSRQLGAIRDLSGARFHFLAAVLLDERYTVKRAAIIPHALIVEHSSFVERTNSHRFLLRDAIWAAKGVLDVTAKLRAASL